MKKLASLILAVMLVLAMAVPAMAADETAATTYSITINNSATDHTYEAYQIFAGDLSGAAENDSVANTTAVLSNIVWGASVTNAANLTGDNDAAKVAEKLANGTMTIEQLLALVTLSTTAYKDSGNTSNPYVISDLEPGYYLVKDQDNSLNGDNDSYTEFILEVVENSTVSPKSDVPEVQKKVKDSNDTAGTTTDWQDSADHDIGDDVPFQLTATLPSNLASYDTYKLIFHDTQSAGLTFNANSVKVYVGNVEVKSGYTVSTNNTDNCTFEVIINDVNSLKDANNNAITVSASSKIIVEYTAELNENAVIGAVGNPNEVYLEYSNNPNWDGEGTEDTGKTPEDKVIVFTYKVVVDKYANEVGNDKKLTGAGFTLYKKNSAGTYVAVGEEVTGATMTTFEWKGLDDGDYKLAETTTPAGYNTMADIYFTITAAHDTTADDPKLTSLTGNAVNGTAEFTTVSHTYENGEGTEDDVVSQNAGLSTNVVNKSGSTLPETGGMGTTLIYVAGTLLVAGAVIVMISKKRAASK